MTFKTGVWGKQAKIRSIRRKAYFRQYARKRRYAHTGKLYNDSNPIFYRMGELEALKILKGAIDKNKNGFGKYDIEWMEYKIDVKTSNRLLRQGCKTFGWKFNLFRQRRKVDFFLLLCFLDNSLEYAFLIPDRELEKNKYLSIASSNISHFEKFLIK